MEQFVALLDEPAGAIATIADLPPETAARFSAQTRCVWISRDYASKIVWRHLISFDELRFMQKAIDNGYILAGRDAQYLEFVYIDPAAYRHFLLVLKVANAGQEVWVQTFHRTDADGLKSKRKRLLLLREHA